jgi:hypothetical protein
MNKYTVKIEPEALADIQEITDWYNQAQPGLGGRFQKTAIKQINSLSKDPHFSLSPASVNFYFYNPILTPGPDLNRT